MPIDATRPARLTLRRLLGLLLLATIASGCGSRLTDVYLDPTFDEKALEQSRIGVLGAVSLPGPDDVDTRITGRERVHAAMSIERDDLDWADPSALWIALGPDLAHELLDAYRASGRFGPEQLERLSVVSDRVRYVVVARIDLDLTSYDFDRRERDAGGRWVLEVDPRGRRELGVGFDVFDLQQRTLVYTARLQRVESERGQTLEQEMVETAPTEADYVRVTRELFDRGPLPDPPARDAVLANLAREAAQRLPGGKGN